MSQIDWISWLLDAATPSIRYFTPRRLMARGEDDPDVQAARRAMSATGPIPAILAMQTEMGNWAGERSYYTPKYVSTHWSMMLLAELAADGSDPRMRRGATFMLGATQAELNDKLTKGKSGGHVSGEMCCATPFTAVSAATRGCAPLSAISRTMAWRPAGAARGAACAGSEGDNPKGAGFLARRAPSHRGVLSDAGEDSPAVVPAQFPAILPGRHPICTACGGGAWRPRSPRGATGAGVAARASQIQWAVAGGQPVPAADVGGAR
jgi:hypothetical protein